MLKEAIKKYSPQLLALSLMLVNVGCRYETPSFLKKREKDPKLDIGFRCNNQGQLNTNLAWFDPSQREVYIKIDNQSQSTNGIVTSNLERNNRAMLITSENGSFGSNKGPVKIKPGDEMKVTVVDARSNNPIVEKNAKASCNK